MKSQGRLTTLENGSMRPQGVTYNKMLPVSFWSIAQKYKENRQVPKNLHCYSWRMMLEEFFNGTGEIIGIEMGYCIWFYVFILLRAFIDDKVIIWHQPPIVVLPRRKEHEKWRSLHSPFSINILHIFARGVYEKSQPRILVYSICQPITEVFCV